MLYTAATDQEARKGPHRSKTSSKHMLLTCVPVVRLQELEDQYRKEREEANNLLEQQRLVQ